VNEHVPVKPSSALSVGMAGALLLAVTQARADPAPDSSAAPVAPGVLVAPAPLATPLGPNTVVRELDQHFVFDPIFDGVITAAGFGFSGLLTLVLGTGEIKPASPNVSADQLISFDRTAVTQTIDKNAATYSDIGLYSAVGFAVLDPILSGFRDGWDAALVDGFMYAESGSIALTLTDLTKIAVRRPRPIDYVNCPAQAVSTTNPNGVSTNPGCGTSTDLGLSFFSGHASTVAAIGATATYLAFVRAPHSPRPWITLGVATALTAFVSYERVRSGEHFPTDVIAGSMAGAAVGVIVPHLHRHQQDAPSVWVGVAPVPGGGSAALQGFF
jgi:membrane-associated phospholipid phosphatase